MKKIYLLILLLVFLIIPFSCRQKDVEPDFKMASVLYKLDVSDAEVLVFMNYYNTYTPNALYKVTKDGELEEVSHLSVTGKKLAPSFYAYYFGMTDNYILISSTNNEICLVRKSDGVVFRIASQDPMLPSLVTYANGKIKTSTDAQGNIYFLGDNRMGNHFVYKISVIPSAFMKVSKYSLEGEYVTDFEVDSRGNMVYTFTPDFSSTFYYRLKKADGSISDVTPFAGLSLGKDDHFYVSQSSGYSTIDISRINIDNSLAVNYTYLGSYPGNYTAFDAECKAYNGDKTVFAYESNITQLDPDNGSVTNYTSPASYPLSDISYSSTDLYLLESYHNAYNGTVVYKIPNSNYASYSYPVSPWNYNIKSIAATNTGNLILSGTRTSDAREVLVKVDNLGNITTLSDDIYLNSAFLLKFD